MVFGPPFFAVPDMKVIGWFSKKGYIAVFMTRRRKLLHIWPTEYSGDGSRGLQTLSREKYSLHLDTGSFSVYSIQAKSYWFEPQSGMSKKTRYISWHSVQSLNYTLSLFLKNRIALKMTFCLFGNIPLLLVLWGTNDSLGGNTSLMHPTAQSCKSLGATTTSLFGQQP